MFLGSLSGQRLQSFFIFLLLVGTESNIRCPDPQEALKEYVHLPTSNTPMKKGSQSQSMLILILDELDSLRSQDCSILYSLFGLLQVKGLPSVLLGKEVLLKNVASLTRLSVQLSICMFWTLKPSKSYPLGVDLTLIEQLLLLCSCQAQDSS